MQSLERLETTGLVKRWPLALAFMIRRIFRIYPLSVLFVLAVVIFHIPHFPGDVYAWPGWRTFLSNLAIVQNLTKSRALLAPLWTLPVEVQMYGMLPFLYFGVRNGRFRSLFFWVISVVAALVVPTIFLGRLNIILYAPCFLAGIVAYELTKTCRKRLPAWLWPVVLALAVAAWQPVSRMDFKIEVRLGWIFALAVGFLVPQFREITAPALAKPAHWIAKYSYGLYLSHVVVYWFAIDVMRHDSLAARIAAGVAGIVLLPVAVFHLVEEPFILLGAKYASRIRDFSVKLGARTNRGLRSTRPVVP